MRSVCNIAASAQSIFVLGLLIAFVAVVGYVTSPINEDTRTLRSAFSSIIAYLNFDLDYFALIAITAIFGGLGIAIGYHVEPAFYSQAIIIFGMFAFLVVRDIRS